MSQVSLLLNNILLWAKSKLLTSDSFLTCITAITPYWSLCLYFWHPNLSSRQKLEWIFISHSFYGIPLLKTLQWLSITLGKNLNLPFFTRPWMIWFPSNSLTLFPSTSFSHSSLASYLLSSFSISSFPWNIVKILSFTPFRILYKVNFSMKPSLNNLCKFPSPHFMLNSHILHISFLLSVSPIKCKLHKGRDLAYFARSCIWHIKYIQKIFVGWFNK